MHGEKGKRENVQERDVFRLFAIVDPEFSTELSPQVRSDLITFIERIAGENIAFKSLGRGQQSMEDVLAELRRIYRLG